MAGVSPNLSAAKRFQATMRANNPGIVPDKEGTARTLDAARRWQQSMRLREPGIVGNATSRLSQALVESAQPAQHAQSAARVQPAQIPVSAQPLQMGARIANGGKAIVDAGTKALMTGGGKVVADTGTKALAVRAGGELVKQGGKAVVDTAIKQIPGQLAKTGGNLLAMNAAKAVLPIAVVAAAQKGAGEFPELEKLRREEAENRRVKMQRGMQTGMGNSSPGGYRHETHMTGLKGEYKPIEDNTGYAVSLIERGKSFDEARRLMQGTEKFRNMSDEMKQFSLAHFDTWRKNQLSSEGRNKLNAYFASEKAAREKAAADAAYNKARMTGPSPDITGLRKPLRRAFGMEK